MKGRRSCEFVGSLDSNSQNASRQTWNATDIAFAAVELSREYPSKNETDIAAAVNLAAAEILPEEGRVKLAVRARQLLRK